MTKVVLVLAGLFIVNASFSQISGKYAENELLIKFKTEANINFKNCIAQQKFDHSTLDILNEKFNVQSIELTGNKKKRDTYLLKFGTTQEIEQLIKLYQDTELFEMVIMSLHRETTPMV